MVREIRVHDDDVRPRRVLQAVDVRRAQAQFARPWPQVDSVRVCFGQLRRDFLGAVRGGVVDDYDFPVEFSARRD